MTTTRNTDALRSLENAVESGTATELQFYTFRPGLSGTVKESKAMFRVYNGSLDAAKTLHDALFPGWRYDLLRRGNRHTCHISEVLEVDGVSAVSDTPSRAWLLAIIRALIAQKATP